MRRSIVTVAAVVAWSAVAHAAAPAKPPPPKQEEKKAQESIGSATMSKDGTIRLMLRATGGGAVGDALLLYPPSHKEYATILKHLGGLKPGESKPVPPFP